MMINSSGSVIIQLLFVALQQCNIFDHSNLFSGINRDDFFAYVWRKRYASLRLDDSVIVNELLDIPAIEGILDHGPSVYGTTITTTINDLRPLDDNDVKLVKRIRRNNKWATAKLPVKTWSTRVARSAFNRGFSLVMNRMDQRWAPIAHLCNRFTAVFGLRCHANMYFTPAGTQAFATHFDVQEVFIIQIRGRKRWRLYPVAFRGPFQRHKFEPDEKMYTSVNATELVLEPADVLYIPAGMMHEAIAMNDSPSLHVTVGVEYDEFVSMSGMLQRIASNDTVRRFYTELANDPMDELGLRNLVQECNHDHDACWRQTQRCAPTAIDPDDLSNAIVRTQFALAQNLRSQRAWQERLLSHHRV